MLTFPPFDPDAERVLTFDCTPQLHVNEVLQGGITLKSIVCTAGIDPNPIAMVLSAPSYDETGRMILVPVGNLSAMAGNDYEIELESATTQAFTIVVARALLQVRVT